MDNKRRLFIAATLIITVLYFLSQSAPFEWRYRALFFLAALSEIYFLLVFRKIAKRKRNALLATFLPISFLAGMSLFSLLFFQGLVWRIVLLLIFAFGLYTLFLIENVFLVSAEFKSVPLYRAASTVGFLLTLVTAFFLFDVLFSFRLAAWFNGLAVSLISLFLLGHFFWATYLSAPAEGDSLVLTGIFSLIMGEMSVAISFWPVGVGKASLYLVSLLYVFGGVAEAFCRQRLFKKTFLEFFWVGLGTFLALFLVTSWRGSF